MDFPNHALPAGPILTPYSREFGLQINNTSSANALHAAASRAWAITNKAYYYHFRLSTFEMVHQLLWFVGTTSNGNIDVGIYTAEGKLKISAGTTAMSVTTSTIQEINFADRAST